MLEPTVPHRIEEFPELFADACLRNGEGEFKFLSLYGRDGAVMQFMAAMDLGAKERGVLRFHLVDGVGERHPADVGANGRLVKHAGRLPRQNLFGPLSQVWIYDTALTQLDRANRIGWVVHRRTMTDAAEELDRKAWRLVQRLSPVALLDHWQAPLMAWCREKQAVEALGSALYPVIGPVEAMRISISDHFVKFVSDGVRLGQLKP